MYRTIEHETTINDDTTSEQWTPQKGQAIGHTSCQLICHLNIHKTVDSKAWSTVYIDFITGNKSNRLKPSKHGHC